MSTVNAGPFHVVIEASTYRPTASSWMFTMPELIWFGSRAMLRRLTGNNRSLSIGSVVVDSVDVVRDLGVLLDSGVDHETTHRPRRQRQILPPSLAETTSAPYYSRRHETDRLLFNTL